MGISEQDSPASAGQAAGSPRLLRLWGGGVLLLVLLYVAIDLRLPTRDVAPGVPLDAALHLACFAGLAVVAPLAFGRAGSALASILFLLALGMFLEITQYYLPHRVFSLYDAGANVLGLAAGAAPGFALRVVARRRS
ncbi:MAG: VanZ family protein [Thermodesulfobacteriota bacterium]